MTCNMKAFHCIIIALLVFANTTLAQTSSIKINRIEVQEGSPYGSGTPSSNVISQLGLNQSSYKGYYSYWRLPNASTQTINNADGSVSSVLNSIPLKISLSNKGQEITFEVTNNSNYWIGIDPSSNNYNISYFSGDDMIPYTGADFSKTLGMLFNYERGEYDYIILPPKAKASWSMFRVDGLQNGYDIISSCIKNGSRMDFTFPIYIYSTDPLSSELTKMRKRSPYQYSPQTPTKVRLSYKGPYYKEGEAYHIHNDYIDLVRPNYSYTIEPAKLKFVCDIVISPATTPSKKNSFGLNVYSR